MNQSCNAAIWAVCRQSQHRTREMFSYLSDPTSNLVNFGLISFYTGLILNASLSWCDAAVIRYDFLPVVTTHKTLSENKSLIILRFLSSSVSFLILKFICWQTKYPFAAARHLTKHLVSEEQVFEVDYVYDVYCFTSLLSCFYPKKISQKSQIILWGSSPQANEIKVKFKCLGNFTIPRFYIRSPHHRFYSALGFFGMGKKKRKKETQHTTREEVFLSSFFLLQAQVVWSHISRKVI